MECPRCGGSFEQVVFKDTVVDRCTTCKGLWFDILEAERLRVLRGAAKLDVGGDEAMQDYQPLTDIICPKCQTRMTRLADNKDHNLTYRKCPVCYGVWFDPGTFRVYQSGHGFVGSLRRLLSRNRP